MKIINFGLILLLGLFIVFGAEIGHAQSPQRPLRTIIPPPLPPEKETPPAAGETEEKGKAAPKKEVEEAAPPEAEEEEPAEPTQEEKVEALEKEKTEKEREEQKKLRDQYLKEAQNLITQLENLRVTIEFGGGYWEEFRKRLLEAAFTLNRVRSLAQGPMARADSLGLMETAIYNFVRVKDAWEQAQSKKDEANHAYQRAEDLFPDTYRRYYRERREAALGNLDEVGAPWIKDYFEFKKMGDDAKKESEQLMQLRDIYVNAAYASLDSAREALGREGKY